LPEAGWPVRSVIAALGVVALFSACGDDGAGNRGEPSPVTSPAPTSLATPAAGASVAASVTALSTAAAATTHEVDVATAPPPQTASFCDPAIPDSQPGTVASPDLVEISGIAASRMQDVIWAHNDSGDTARVFAMGLDGSALATYALNGAEAIDWEDMAIGPGPEDGIDYLYLADIGDNASVRPAIAVYRAREPEFDPAEPSLTVDADAIALTYPDGAHDSETLLVDPVTGDLFIVTKDILGGPSGLYRASAPDASGGSIVLERVAVIDFAALSPRREVPADAGPLPMALGNVPTGGDISPDGSTIAIRTYGTVWLWHREPGTTIADAFADAPCEGPSAIEPQGEAIAFDGMGRGYFTVSEGVNPPLHQFRHR